mgnify:CR=1 FL=1
MNISQENLIDVLQYYMEDNNIGYVNLKASLSSDGESIKINIIQDLEDEME